MMFPPNSDMYSLYRIKKLSTDLKILDPENVVDGDDKASLGQLHQPKLCKLMIISEADLRFQKQVKI